MTTIYGRPAVYLSGPMSGMPALNKPRFNMAAEKLRSMGFTVENPAEAPEQVSWADYMRYDLARMLETCGAVVQLEGWQLSRGASIEAYVASLLDIPCVSIHDDLALRRLLHGKPVPVTCTLIPLPQPWATPKDTRPLEPLPNVNLGA